MRATQHTIAKLANVSQATVSRVLKGDTRVEPELRERVLQIAKAQNYQPDMRAKSLRERKTYQVGLVLKRPSGSVTLDPFFAALTASLLSYLAESDYRLVLELATAETQEAIYDEMLRMRVVDGLILVESEARDERIHRLQADRFPFVVIGNPGAGRVWSVDNDNVLAAETATAHLIQEGYRRVGMIAGPKGVMVSEDRILGYQRACERFGYPARVWHSSFGADAARAAAFEALSSPSSPDALVVLDDFMAMGAVMAARELGLCVPSQVGLVGFNNSYICELIEGGLTSVDLGIQEIVRLAVRQLLNIIDNVVEDDPFRRVVPCELHVRGSSTRALMESRL